MSAQEDSPIAKVVTMMRRIALLLIALPFKTGEPFHCPGWIRWPQTGLLSTKYYVFTVSGFWFLVAGFQKLATSNQKPEIRTRLIYELRRSRPFFRAKSALKPDDGIEHADG